MARVPTPRTCLDSHIAIRLYAAGMSSTWSALADPHRRAVLELLRERPRSVGELVEGVGLSQPGTSKHLRVLRQAGLVTARADAQRRVYALDTRPLAELDAWLDPYRRLWEQRLDALERHLDRKAAAANEQED
jgi:DNA-binding transcriptional ArsR family regulator